MERSGRTDQGLVVRWPRGAELGEDLCEGTLIALLRAAAAGAPAAGAAGMWLLEFEQPVFAKGTDALRQLVQHIAARELPAGTPSGWLAPQALLVMAPANGGADFGDRMARLRAEIRDGIQAGGRFAAAVALLRCREVRDEGLVFARLPEAEPRSRARPVAEKGASRRLVLTDARLEGFPIWQVKKNAIYGHECEILWPIDGNRTAEERDLPRTFERPEARFVLDLEILRLAVDLADMSLQAGASTNFTIPVHLETLLSEGRRGEYIHEFCRLVGGYPDLVSVDVRGLRTVKDLKGLDGIGQMKPLCRDLLLSLPPDFKDHEALPLHLFTGLSINTRGAPPSEQSALRPFETLARAASGFGLRSFVFGLDSMSLVTAAACAGIDMIGTVFLSRLIDPSSGTIPPQVLPRDLYRALLMTKADAGEG